MKECVWSRLLLFYVNQIPKYVEVLPPGINNKFPSCQVAFATILAIIRMLTKQPPSTIELWLQLARL